MHGSETFTICEDKPKNIPTQTFMRTHFDQEWLPPGGGQKGQEFLYNVELVLLIRATYPADLAHFVLTNRKWHGAWIYGRVVQESQVVLVQPTS